MSESSRKSVYSISLNNTTPQSCVVYYLCWNAIFSFFFFFLLLLSPFARPLLSIIADDLRWRFRFCAPTGCPWPAKTERRYDHRTTTVPSREVDVQLKFTQPKVNGCVSVRWKNVIRVCGQSVQTTSTKHVGKSPSTWTMVVIR